MGKYGDLTGQTFAYLTVMGCATGRGERKIRGEQWLCRCTCGNTIIVSQGQLVRKDDKGTKSCGCLKHSVGDQSKERLYRTWFDMIRRCHDPRTANFPNYGQRGIRVCDDWKNSFATFKDWALSHGYSDDLTIDRINVNGNYEPLNCRWATVEIQKNNKRTNRYVSYRGKTYTVTQFALLLGVSTKTIYNRIADGLSIDAIAERYLPKDEQRQST